MLCDHGKKYTFTNGIISDAKIKKSGEYGNDNLSIREATMGISGREG